jgi:hypothetical protein
MDGVQDGYLTINLLCRIQPPGQLHAEYNPNTALARGGHFFTYGTLHHTHSSRSLEVTQGNSNQAHKYTDETLWRMAALIPRLPPDQLSGKCVYNIACSLPLNLLAEKASMPVHCWHFVAWFSSPELLWHSAWYQYPTRKSNP